MTDAAHTVNVAMVHLVQVKKKSLCALFTAISIELLCQSKWWQCLFMQIQTCLKTILYVETLHFFKLILYSLYVNTLHFLLLILYIFIYVETLHVFMSILHVSLFYNFAVHHVYVLLRNGEKP